MYDSLDAVLSPSEFGIGGGGPHCLWCPGCGTLVFVEAFSREDVDFISLHPLRRTERRQIECDTGKTAYERTSVSGAELFRIFSDSLGGEQSSTILLKALCENPKQAQVS